VPDYTLPASYHVDHWEKEIEKIKNAAKMMDPNFNPMDELVKKEEVKMPTKDNLMKSHDKDKEMESNIKIPGLTDKDKEKENKKPLIMEMESDKYTPNYEISHVVEDGLDKVVFVFQVPEETSAKNIDMDVSSTQIKLDSKK